MKINTESSLTENFFDVKIKRKTFFSTAGAALGILGGYTDARGGTAKISLTFSRLNISDTELLKHFFVIEQLSSAFYKRVLTNPFYSVTAKELSYLSAIAHHEQTHENSFKEIFSLQKHDIEVDFSSIDFNDRDVVLSQALCFEKLEISTCNNLMYFLKDEAALYNLSKILTVEARHLAVISQMWGADSKDLISQIELNDNKSLMSMANQFLKKTISFPI